MSLECEGDGAACVECGDFDFLPHTCPYCHGVFCAAHASCHHVPASTGSPAVLCAPPPPPPSADPPRQSESAKVNFSSGADAAARQVRCVVCQSFPCVLMPCTLCGEAFCALHRFHGHEDAALQARLGKRAAQVAAKEAGAAAAAAGAPSTGSLHALCAPFTNHHPLTLAPVGYRSRHMDVLALVVSLASAGNAAPHVPASSSASAQRDVGVCSLVVATEMSVGQLHDRLVAELMSEQQAEPGTATAPHTSLFSLVPVDALTDKEEGAPSPVAASRRRPTLSLLPLPPDVILRKAPLSNATVVFAALPADTAADTAEVALRLSTVLTEFLFGGGGGASPATTRQDSRVKALPTRLYLQHQQLLRRSAASGSAPTDTSLPPASSASVSGTTDNALVGGSVGAEGPSSSPASPPASAAVIDDAVWPFRHPPPLNSFPFWNPKLRPVGVEAVRPPTAPRVIVALFTADAGLPCAVQPMVVALGQGWPAARVLDRLREEVVDRQCGGAHRASAAQTLQSFSLYRLHQAGEEEVELLPSTAPPPLLQNAEVLVLCPAEPPVAVAALRAEVRRMRAMTGKEQRALKADQIKLCSVM